ncbi:MAG: hypothetical protein L6Q57_03490 [Alphaproteobacteria bacterium]|nr:hypothetical protein [Alphaproteobacteria bacterium]
MVEPHYEFARLSAHRAIPVPGMWAVEYAKNPNITPQEFFADPQSMRRFFGDLHKHMLHQGVGKESSLVIIHCGQTWTNSKQPNLHVHFKEGAFPESHAHITTQKTFVATPNAGLAAYIDSKVPQLAKSDLEESGFLIVVPRKYREAPKHFVLAFPSYDNLFDFGDQCARGIVPERLSQMVSAIFKKYGAPEKGVRLVIDGMVNPTKCFTIHALTGGPLWQGSNPHRWFEAPAL